MSRDQLTLEIKKREKREEKSINAGLWLNFDG